jgi:hypothetical protein
VTHVAGVQMPRLIDSFVATETKSAASQLQISPDAQSASVSHELTQYGTTPGNETFACTQYALGRELQSASLAHVVGVAAPASPPAPALAGDSSCGD